MTSHFYDQLKVNLKNETDMRYLVKKGCGGRGVKLHIIFFEGRGPCVIVTSRDKIWLALQSIPFLKIKIGKTFPLNPIKSDSTISYAFRCHTSVLGLTQNLIPNLYTFKKLKFVRLRKKKYLEVGWSKPVVMETGALHILRHLHSHRPIG